MRNAITGSLNYVRALFESLGDDQPLLVRQPLWSKFDRRVRGLGIPQVRTLLRSPRANPVAER